MNIAHTHVAYMHEFRVSSFFFFIEVAFTEGGDSIKWKMNLIDLNL